MALTEAEIDAKITALQIELARPQRSITFADRGTILKSNEELLQALAYYESLKASLVERPRQFLGYSKKGF